MKYPSYSNDTRTMQPGEIYVAIRGERYDGHEFIPAAVEKEAGGLIVDRDISRFDIPPHIPVTRVEDVTLHLGKLAHERLLALDTTVVAVTGSVGKTTMKGALATVIGQSFPVVVPRWNWNTLLGLSLTALNEVSDPAQVFVVEVSAYLRGEIAQICQQIPPKIAVVTSVQPVHLERMKTIENITLAKRELVEALKEDGYAVLNSADPRVCSMAEHCRGKVIYYGHGECADVTPANLPATPKLVAPYWPEVATACVAAARCLGMQEDAIRRGILNLKPEKGRLQLLPGVKGITLLDDTYNAAPLSTLAALKALRQQDAARRVAFLGDMLELGDTEAEGHRQVVQEALTTADLLILVGPRMAAALESLGLECGEKLAHFDHSTGVVAALENGEVYTPQPGDCVLVKGSAGIRMERVTAQLLSPEVDPSEVLVRQDIRWHGV